MRTQVGHFFFFIRFTYTDNLKRKALCLTFTVFFFFLIIIIIIFPLYEFLFSSFCFLFKDTCLFYTPPEKKGRREKKKKKQSPLVIERALFFFFYAVPKERKASHIRISDVLFHFTKVTTKLLFSFLTYLPFFFFLLFFFPAIKCQLVR